MVTDDQRFFAGITLTAISSSFFRADHVAREAGPRPGGRLRWSGSGPMGLDPQRPRIVNRQANREITSAACAPSGSHPKRAPAPPSGALLLDNLDGDFFELLGPDDVTVDSQLRWAASAVPTICANPTVSPRADCPCQRHRRNSDKQLGTSLVVADRPLLADEILGNVFQQVGFLEGFSKKGVDPDLSREAPVFVRGAG